MALSDQLTKLAERAKAAEEHAVAIQAKAKSELEQDLKEARETSQAHADALSAAIDKQGDKVSSWWADVQRSWNKHMGAIRKDMEQKKTAHDLKVAKHKAEKAEADASFAIDFAYSAVVEAEYAVIDAALARMNADELAQTQ